MLICSKFNPIICGNAVFRGHMPTHMTLRYIMPNVPSLHGMQAKALLVLILVRSKESGLPIATLPMLSGRMYSIWSPDLIHAALRSKALSFEPFMKEFAQPVLGISEDAFAPIRGPPERESF